MTKKGIRVDRFTWQPGDLVPVNEGEIKGIKPPDEEEVEEQEPGGPETCVCPDCGHEEDKERGVPCRSVKCPECGAMLVAKIEERVVDFFNQDGKVYLYDEDADFVAERTVRMTRPEGASVQRLTLELLSGPDGGPITEGTYKLTFGRGDTVEFILEGLDALDGRYQLSRIDDAWILRRPVEQNTTYPEEHDIDAAIAEAKRLGHDKLLWRETPGSDLRTIDV